MPTELRLPTLTRADDPKAVLAWASELVLQLRRQHVPVIKRLQPLSPYGLQIEDGNGNLFTPLLFKVDEAIVNVAVSATATAMVRPGLCFGVFAQNLTAIIGGLASYDIGTTTPADGDAWHDSHVLNIQTRENADEWLRTEDFTLATGALPQKYDAPTDIVLTPNGGIFVSGLVKLISFTLDFKIAP